MLNWINRLPEKSSIHPSKQSLKVSFKVRDLQVTETKQIPAGGKSCRLLTYTTVCGAAFSIPYQEK